MRVVMFVSVCFYSGLLACTTFERSPRSGYASTDFSAGSGSLKSFSEIDSYDPRFRENSTLGSSAFRRPAHRPGLWSMKAPSQQKDFGPLIHDRDIALGMDKESVRESWGDPRAIDIAGQSHRQNERWTYIEYVSSPEGYQEKERVVYFERGEVVGWKSE